MYELGCNRDNETFAGFLPYFLDFNEVDVFFHQISFIELDGGGDEHKGEG